MSALGFPPPGALTALAAKLSVEVSAVSLKELTWVSDRLMLTTVQEPVVATLESVNPALKELAVGITCFALAFVLASLVEYWLHRLMHVSPKIGERHRDHHRRNEGQGVLWEFRDYVRGSLVVMCLMFFYSWSAGIGWFLGGLVYAAFSAYAHQLQHENPTKCFWMKMPVHYVHHKYGMWHHNFGLAVDWWDHIFGTYKPVEWLTEEELKQPERDYIQLRWW